MESYTRRNFIKKTAASSAALSFAGLLPAMSAKSYSRIMGSNERMKIGVLGCGGMANHHMRALLEMKETDNVEIASVCDVYMKRLDQASELTRARAFKNYQDILNDKDIDYVLIATPEHWHYEMTLDAIGAGEHI